MSKLTFKIFICSLFLAFNFSATIRGKIYDQNSGNTLVGANVYLENTSLGGSTNVDGQYIITDIPNNSNYTITVKYLGYKEYSQEINLFDKELLDLDIMLSPSNIKVKGAEIIGSTKTINDKITNITEKFKELKSLVFEYKDKKESEINRLSEEQMHLKNEIDQNKDEAQL